LLICLKTFRELKNEELFHQLYAKESLGAFWTHVKKEKPMIGTETVKILLPFSATPWQARIFSSDWNQKEDEEQARTNS